MKLRIRIGSRSERISINDEGLKTLKQLCCIVEDVLRLEPRSFELSMNGREPIKGSPDDPLETFGIVSGDLIKVLVKESESSSSSQNGAAASNTTGAKPKEKQRPDTRINGSLVTPLLPREHMPLDGRPDNREVGGENQKSEMSQEEKEARDQLAQLEKEAEEGEMISEPMFCRDADGDRIPLHLKQLCEEIKPGTSSDAVFLVVHALMVETGFYAHEATTNSLDLPSAAGMEDKEVGDPVEDADPTARLPTGWRTGTSYKLTYHHPECKGLQCTLAGVNMGTVLLLHGLNGKKIHATMQLKPVLYTSYLVGSFAFNNLAYLSRSFKDTIVYPLLAAMRADLGLPPLHGLLALFPEIQLKILSFLDLQSVVSMSTVCQHFNNLISDPLLWRQLLLRDFGGKDSDKHCNWKNVYKERYRLKKLREQLRRRIQNSFYPPGRRPFAFVPPVPHPIPGVYPPGYRGGDYDIDPFHAGGALPGYPTPGFQPIPGPLAPRPLVPRHDPIFPNPDANHRPGYGGGLMDLETGRPHPYNPQPPQGFPGMSGRTTGGRSAGGMRGLLR